MEDFNKETSEQKIQKLTGFDKKQKVLLLLLVGFILLTPIIFTQLPVIVDFTGTGNVGDTIGGITAPFINLLAAYLVYRSFSAQIAANIYQRADFEKQIQEIRLDRRADYLKSLFDEIEKNFEISEGRSPKMESWVLSLRNAFNVYGNSIRRATNPQMVESYRKQLEAEIKTPLIEIERNFEILILLVDELFAERNGRLYADNNLEIWYQHRLSTLMKKYHYLGFNDKLTLLYTKLENDDMTQSDRDSVLRIFDMYTQIIQNAKLRSF